MAEISQSRNARGARRTVWSAMRGGLLSVGVIIVVMFAGHGRTGGGQNLLTTPSMAAVVSAPPSVVPAKNAQAPVEFVPLGMTREQARRDGEAARAWENKKYPGLTAEERAKREVADMTAAMDQAEATIRANARDPGSLKFDFNRYVGLEHGWWGDVKYVCGAVNGKNGFGGRTGFQYYVLMMSGRQAGLLHIGVPKKSVQKACGETAGEL